MKIRRTFVGLAVVAAAAMLGGCGSEDTPPSAIPTRLTMDAKKIFESTADGVIRKADWPKSIRGLAPLSVRLDEEGLYIQTWKRSVEEGGLFVPKAQEKEYDESTDPGYRKAVNGVYYYKIKG